MITFNDIIRTQNLTYQREEIYLEKYARKPFIRAVVLVFHLSSLD
jgi:hypothetical protein